MFALKESNMNLRDSSILFNIIQYGKNTFSYYGSHLWNLFSNELKRTVDLISFKKLLHTWEGPACCKL